ncbi:hypothetical protein Xcel_1937 [Xylanimonas cellulosilytica DSM 15894]|uniref:Transcriptional regulator HTH-type FeoC domain-containing protein n=1 Tax=Xylanimonas cellulosilytica (strain DSM 15894 / JCM 12276 / CECT 5975 / KCTC 9989 / LMG 20990 / NBRC 107835 / XIL07) TaxID=446471 RepID=D1BTH7_XYLCX|nr:hypothetical protein [Xylanimonas cellulosilytica]ACZ30956.1 hypothetical protein Xcel_1937 [Xylanimonas cellulosilytica DSM 15894]
MSTLTDVLDAVRSGVPGERVAAHLGVDPGLADLALEHWMRLGIVTLAGDLQLGCTGCASPSGSERAERGPGCAGCPFSR